MKKPLVSILMSTYNGSNYIHMAIKSVLEQTFMSWELLIVNDASTDSTDNAVKKFHDPRMKYFFNKINKGLTKNLITLSKLAEGKYIARIDDDDIWSSKEKLNKQVSFLEKNPEYALVGTWAKAINRQGKFLYNLSYQIEDKNIRNRILLENCFIHSSVLLRKDFYKKVGGYKITSDTTQDYSLWLRFGRKYKFHNIPEYLVRYRINKFGITQNKYKELISHSLKFVRDNKKYYPNYYLAFIIWNTRRFYPPIFRDILSFKIRNLLKSTKYFQTI